MGVDRPWHTWPPWDSSGCGKVLKSLPAGNGGATLKITTSKPPKAQVLAGGESTKKTGRRVKLLWFIRNKAMEMKWYTLPETNIAPGNGWLEY